MAHYDIDLLKPSAQENPFPLYRKLRDDFPVNQMKNYGFWAISRYEDVRYALLNPDIFVSSNAQNVLIPEWMAGEKSRDFILSFDDKPLHTKHRRAIATHFTSKSMKAFTPMLRKVAEDDVARISPDTTFDFLEKFCRPFTEQVIGHFTGIDDPLCFQVCRRWFKFLEQQTLKPDPHYIEAFTRCDNQLVRCLTDIVEQRGKSPKSDLITELVQSRTTANLGTGDIVRQLVEAIVFAGTLPMVYLLGRAVLQLAHAPELLETLVNDPTRISSFVDELIRRDSPVHFIPRRTSSAVTLAGVTIPAGAPVALLLASANHDPLQFPNPETFDISRTNSNTQLGFGAGIHRCTGASLAKIQMVIVLEELLKRFQYISCPTSSELSWFYSFSMHGMKQLPVSLH